MGFLAIPDAFGTSAVLAQRDQAEKTCGPTFRKGRFCVQELDGKEYFYRAKPVHAIGATSPVTPRRLHKAAK